MDAVYTIDRRDFLRSDGTLKIMRFAQNAGIDPETGLQRLDVETGPQSVAMAHSPATGAGLVSNGQIGADMIRLSAGTGFVPHTHPGDHLLIVIAGEGTITYDGRVYPTEAGQIYLIEGEIPHAVGAITDHVILAVGSPHKPVDSTDRMAPVEYEAVTAEVKSLHCLICDIEATLPQRLHDAGCPHCPCDTCNPMDAD